MNLPDFLHADSLLNSLQQFHFIRPYWLLLIIPALVTSVLLFIRAKNNSAWHQHFDPTLLLPLLHGKINRPSKKLPMLVMLSWLICSLALSGPTWEKLPTPVEKRDTALIILLDLSPSMLARDIQPSRLVSARHKILDLLKLRKEGYSALIAYSGDAHVVSPLTDDTQTIANLLNSLEPAMMPIYGSNLEDALKKAQMLFKNAGYTHGDILLVTDGITEQTMTHAIQILNEKKLTLSIIGVGSEDGAPIPDNSGGFLKNNKGEIILPQLQEEKLRSLARQVSGYYSPLQLDDSDIEPLIEGRVDFNHEGNGHEINKKIEREFDQWRDAGGILSLLLIPLLLMGFRRGVLISLIFALPLLHPIDTQAETAGQSVDNLLAWDNLWLNDNQRGMKSMKSMDYKNAARQFSDPDWKASAQYEAGDYTAALKHFQTNLSDNGLYNQGNALAKSGQLEKALTAYKEALKKNPQHDNAAFNMKIVEELLKQQEQNAKQDDQHEQDQPGDQSQPPENGKTNNDNQDSNKSGEQQQSDSSAQKNNPDKSTPDQERQAEQNRDQQQKAREENDKNKSDVDAQKEKSDLGKDQPEETVESQLSPEQKQTLEQWLRQVPDDPSGLLRNKFEYYYQQRLQQKQSGTTDSHLNDEERW
jgi:Ca-activated chloride channel family protein